MFDNLKKKAQELAGQHGDKIEKGLDKAGKVAKDRFGQNEKVDQALNKAKGYLDENRPEDQQSGEQPPGQQPDQGQPDTGQSGQGQPGQQPGNPDDPHGGRPGTAG